LRSAGETGFDRPCVALPPLVVGLLLAACISSPRAQTAGPLVEGPVTGGLGAPLLIGTTLFPLSDVGYEQVEYFISGTASAYTTATPLGTDGRWSVTPGETAAYKTRLLVYRPIDAKAFKGTVVVEWFNVSGGLEAAPDWISAHTEMVRQGMIWVGVSAQFRGVEGGSGGLLNIALKTGDPTRYGTLRHPGDSFSYDIYAQAGHALRATTGVRPLGDLPVKRVLAIGESQSAFRMVTYINAVHPLVPVYDGFLVHSRGGGSAPLSQDPQPAIPTPGPTHIRTDIGVPVLTFQTETDMTVLGYFSDRQPDSEFVRLWEVAGTAHADTYTLLVGMTDLGDSPEAMAVLVTAAPIPGIIECASPVNSGPQHVTLKAALAALERWVRRGKPPRSAPRLEITGTPPTIQRDEYGNAVGGIRTPWVDAPIATLSGEGQTGASFCFIFGTTVPFDAATLAALYPSHRAYVKAYRKATKRALAGGFVRKADAKLMKAQAEAAGIGD
jgi:hypothetical protein